MGDQLLHYIKAKWISYNNNIPVILTPNTHYNHFVLSREENFSYCTSRSRHRIPIEKIDTQLDSNQSAYYLINYFPLPSYENLMKMKKDKLFMKELYRLFTPIKSLSLISPPKNIFSVALHIRTESNSPKGLKSEQIYDLKSLQTEFCTPNNRDFMDFDFPEKFPPLQFYVDQLKYLSEFSGNKPLYIFIFTDDLKPYNIAAQIKKALQLENVVFDYRKDNFHPDNAIVEDFFSMMHFDCIIRPKSSNFSLVADFLGTNIISIFPQTFHWEKDKTDNYYLVIDKTIFDEKF